MEKLIKIFEEVCLNNMNMASEIDEQTASKELAEEAKKISIKFIMWVMSNTEFRHYDYNAYQWTNGAEVISVGKLFEKFLENYSNEN